MKKFTIFILALCVNVVVGAQTYGERVVIPDSIMDMLMTDLEPLGDDSLQNLVDSLVMEIDSLNVAPGELLNLDVLASDSLSIDSLAVDSLKMATDTIKIDASKEKTRKKASKPAVLPEVLEYYKMIRTYRFYRRKWAERWDDIYLITSNNVMSPDYYKYVMPATYYFAPLEDVTNIDNWKPEIPFVKVNEEQYPWNDLRKSKKIDRYINGQLLSFYLEYPQLVIKNETTLRKLDPLSKDMVMVKPKVEDLQRLIETETEVHQVSEKDLLVVKPNFWTLGGNGYLQFSQHYISDNWYKGGESTKSLLSGFVWQANYDNKQNMQFENRLEWKLGFITAPSDTVHSYKANNDLFRFSSKLGFKAVKNWYYTLSVDFKTQFFANYETNSDKKISSFLSPAELNVGLGMDFKYVKDAKYNLSVLINPLNYTLYGVSDNDVDPTKFNIKTGHKTESVLGSRMEAMLKWKIAHNLIWESRLTYQTNYEKSMGEWENTFTYSFNRYLSSKLFVHGRFDDGVTRKEGDSYFQMQELLSFGLNYTW